MREGESDATGNATLHRTTIKPTTASSAKTVRRPHSLTHYLYLSCCSHAIHYTAIGRTNA